MLAAKSTESWQRALRSSAMTDELVHVAVADGVATITLDSPANRNALSRRLGRRPQRGARRRRGRRRRRVRAGDRADPRPAGVLRRRRPQGAAHRARRTRRRSCARCSRLMDADVPTIAAVDGPARAGGIGLMASCDLVVVQRDLDVRPHRGPHRRRRGDHLGADPAPGERQPARRGVPHRRAVRRRLRPRRRAGHPRHRRRRRHRGRAVRRHPHGRPARRRRDQADAARRCPASSATRRSSGCARLSDELFAGPDAAEGMAAFAEKRPPAWQRAVVGPTGSGRLRRQNGSAASMSSSRDEHEAGRVAERDERVGRGDPPRSAPSNPSSTSPATTASPTPPDAPGLVDDDHPADGAGRGAATSSIGSGASQRRSSTRQPMPSAGQALGDAQRQVQPVAPRHDEHVVALAGDGRRADRHVLVGPRAPAAAYGAVHRSSPGSCRSRVW